jgi:hypothetical protein
MAASCLRPRDAMKNIVLVVAWRDLASIVAINLRRHHFLQYDVLRCAFCCYPHDQLLLLLSSFDLTAYKNLIVASPRFAMVESLSLLPGNTAASRSLKNIMSSCLHDDRHALACNRVIAFCNTT